MAKFLYKVGNLAYRKKWPFLAGWLIILLSIGTLAGLFSKPTSDQMTIPGIDSVTTLEKMQERFPNSDDPLTGPTGSILVQAQDGKTLADPAMMSTMDNMISDLKGTGLLTDSERLVNPVVGAQVLSQQLEKAQTAQGIPPEQIKSNIAALSPLSEDGTTGMINVTVDAPTATDISEQDMDTLQGIINDYNSDELKVIGTGNALTAQPEVGMTSELIGLAVAAVALLVTFGSMVAAGMPLISAIVGVSIGLLGITALTAVSDNITTVTPILSSMIGLAVGIDYALFILARFRGELIKQTGNENTTPEELTQALRKTDVATRAHAMGMAVGTAGSAVVFAGLTVLIALAAMTIINIPFLTVMALTAAGTVAIAVLCALTFLPALLGLMGKKVFSGRVKGPKVPDPDNAKPTMGLRWVSQIRKHPALYVIAGVLGLGLLAIPMMNMQLAMPTAASQPLDSPARQAYEITAEEFGAGRNAPMIALVDTAPIDPQQRPIAIQQAIETFSTTPGVVNAQVVATTENLDSAQVLITPEWGATDPQTTDTLTQLRAGEQTYTDQTGGANYGITGAAAIFDDVSERLQEVLVPYIAIVLVLAFLVLMLVFRSIWVPLIAALGFGLSMIATFGITVAIFQEGKFGLVNDPQPLVSFLPIVLIGLVFGLAMDYQVFLVSRMREYWSKGESAGDATANGFKHGARVVTTAAIIMISVFAAFMLQDMSFIKTMGFALAVAVFIDAFIVRMTIIPATMFLLGEHAWWLPKWINKILPTVDIEGEGITGQHDANEESRSEGTDTKIVSSAE